MNNQTGKFLIVNLQTCIKRYRDYELERFKIDRELISVDSLIHGMDEFIQDLRGFTGAKPFEIFRKFLNDGQMFLLFSRAEMDSVIHNDVCGVILEDEGEFLGAIPLSDIEF